MPYENVWEQQGVYRKYRGLVTGKEILKAAEEVEGDSRFDHIRYVINDFLAVTEQRISPKEIRIIAAIDKAAALSNPDIMVAIVATEQAIQEMAALYCDLSIDSPYPTRMFTGLDEAREWLKALS